MIPSKVKKTISLAISLLVMVISLTGVALGANMPVPVAKLTSYAPGFAGDPGKMARDESGNFYVADFWGKRIVKLNSALGSPSFISTLGRPTAVAALKDGRLAVAMSKPRPYVAFYSQPTGAELSEFGPPAEPYYNPVGITVDDDGNIYVLDSGDLNNTSATVNVPKVRVYSPAGAYLGKLGKRINLSANFTTGGTFKQPLGITYEKLAKQIVVVDALTSRLQFFSKYGADATCYTTDPPSAPSCYQSAKTIGTTAGLASSTAVIGAAVRFYNPVDVAFEYDAAGTALNRIYVAERSRNAISVIDGITNYGFLRGYISYSDLKRPSAILFEKTSTGTGVIYASNAATDTPANIYPISIENGSIPTTSVTMTMDAVPPNSLTSSLNVTGTISSADTVTCSVNGGAAVNAGSGNWSATLTLETGANYILCQSTPGGVRIHKDANTNYMATNTAPIVTITSPAASPSPVYTRSESLIVTGTTSLGSATVQLANSLDISNPITTQSDVSGNWSKAVTLVEGRNDLTVTAWKPGTAVSAGVTRTVVYDNTDPSVTYSFINAGATTTNAVQNLDGIVNEANLQSITVNGVPVAATAQATLGGNNTYFSIPLTLNRGANTVTVTATDMAGRTTTLSRSVSLAPEKPGFVTVAQPADNKFRSSAGVESASGTVDSGITSVVACGGSSVTPVAGSWSATTATIGAGFVSCQLTASDGTSTVNEKRTFITDAAYSLVVINSPAADLATKNASVTVSGSVATSPAVPQISINGVTTSVLPTGTYDYGDGAFTYPVPLQQGLNTIAIISNGTTAVRNIIRDNVMPDLAIQADSKTMPTFIYGSLEPSAKMSAITASFGGTALTPAIPVSKITFAPYDQSGAVTWKADLTGYAYDAISFTALDPALNETTLFYADGIPSGDIDGDGAVRLADALAALRHAAGTDPIDPEIQFARFFNGDVGQLVKGRAARDGIIDIHDAYLILNKAYGLMAF